METKCETARGLLYKVGRMIDADETGPELTKLSAMAKLYCTDIAMEVTTTPSRCSAATATSPSTRSSG